MGKRPGPPRPARRTRTSFHEVIEMEIIAQKNYPDGSVIFLEGSRGDSVYLVEAGAVIISKQVGGKKLIIDVLRTGEIFGEMAFIGNYPRTATARALGDTTLGVIDRESLTAAVTALPPDMRKLVMSLVSRLRKMTDTAAGMTILRKEPRVARTWSVTFSSGEGFSDAYTHNASSGGLFIATDKPLEQGEVFLLDLGLPDGSQLTKVACEVVWTREQTEDSRGFPTGMGVRFIVLTQQDKDKLRAALAGAL
ncbi:MAG: TIGR02266 family protein [Thermodesulfobacteriota bacterium]